jgi:hypothetical protein
MRGIPALFLALLVAHYAPAHGSHGAPGGDSSGLSVGAGFGLHMHRHEDETEIIPNAVVTLAYNESFFDDSLDFDIGLSYIPSFKEGYFEIEEHDHSHDGHDHDGHDHGDDIFATRDFFQQALCLEVALTYNLSLAYFTTLSFSLENETDFYISPRLKGEKNMVGVLTPGIKLNQGFGFGDIYAKYGSPLQYVSYFKEEEFGVGSDVTIGWQSKFGLGLEFIGHFLLAPEAGFDGVNAMISYSLSIRKFSLYAYCEFEGIGLEESVGIVPGIGFTYSF